jgi:hypothetical protein
MGGKPGKILFNDMSLNYSNVFHIIFQKRKGGWPKGKRRKPEIGDKNAPKAPTTG